MAINNNIQIVLGTSAIEITAEPVAENTAELYPKIQVSGVYPTKINSKSQIVNPDEQQNWLYEHDIIVIVTIQMSDGNYFNFDVQNVTNQPTWTPDLSGQQQCVDDINTWLST